VILKSSFGSVKPYTRHTTSCLHRDSPDHNKCRCPKWLYEYRKGQRPKRYSLNTPSWADALEKATETLRSFDLEIAELRAKEEKRQQKLVTVADACDLWIKRTEREFGESGSLDQYKSLMRKVNRWAAAHGIEHIQEITPLQLEKWYSSQDWIRHAETTRKQRWGVLRSMFAFLQERGVIEQSPIAAIRAIRLSSEHVQGPYTDEQVKRIFAHVQDSVPPTVSIEEKKVYPARLNAFLLLLLHTGCDVIDAILFRQDQIQDVEVNGRVVPVYRYFRQKTRHKDSKVQAVIPLLTEVARALRAVPTLPGNPEGMPFRKPAVDERTEVHLWSRRIKSILRRAKIEYVELPRDSKGRSRRKRANAKMFRHTFAVRQLVAKQRVEEVARMLGHVDTTMVRRHYAPWVEERDIAHVTAVVEKWGTGASAQ
jgi:integrase